jgi:hypothetical protein
MHDEFIFQNEQWQEIRMVLRLTQNIPKYQRPNLSGRFATRVE